MKRDCTVQRARIKLLVAPTKGPFSVIEDQGGFLIVHQNNEPGAISKTLAKVFARKSWRTEGRANADLFAAAPDLLNAARLQNLFPLQTAEQQIAAEDFARSLGWKEDGPLDRFAYEYAKAAIAKAEKGDMS